MGPLLSFLASHGLAVAFLLVAIGLGGWSLLRRPQRPTLLFAAGIVALAGVAGLAVPAEIGMWLAIGGAGLLVGLFLWLLLTSQWSVWLGGLAVAILLVGVSGWATVAASEGLVDLGKAVTHLEPVQPAWLWLLLVLPVIIYWSRKSLAGMGPTRRWLAIILRTAILLFLILAMAEVRFRQVNDTVTTLFLVDRSLSIPEESSEDSRKDPVTGRPYDLRWERIKKFINDSVEKRGEAHKRDKAGLIVFARRPRLELPPSDSPRFNFK